MAGESNLELAVIDGSGWTPLFRYLDTNGDGTGTKQAIQNYSAAGLGPKTFYIKPPTGLIYVINRMVVYWQDAISWRSDHYGKLGAALTKGIRVYIRSDKADPIELTDGLPIKTNGNWKRLCHDAPESGYGAGDDDTSARWTFRHSGRPLVLRGDRGDRMDIDINDNLSGLSDQTFMVQGYSMP